MPPIKKSLFEELGVEELKERLKKPPVIALVGGGGKTSLMFGLAGAGASRGWSVLVTTTTHLRDPRGETGRRFDRLILAPDSEGLNRLPGITILASSVESGTGKLKGIDPGLISGSPSSPFDLILVEADGSKGLPLKAPASHEPCVPASSDLVLGLVGLDALGMTASPATIHRFHEFMGITGIKEGEAVEASHILSLVLSPEGLFKGSPDKARRVLVLNKADLVQPAAPAAIKALIEASSSRIEVCIASDR